MKEKTGRVFGSMLFGLFVTTQGQFAFPHCLFSPICISKTLLTPHSTEAAPVKSWVTLRSQIQLMVQSNHLPWPFNTDQVNHCFWKPSPPVPAIPYSLGFLATMHTALSDSKMVSSTNTKWISGKSFLSLDSPNVSKKHDLFLHIGLFLSLRNRGNVPNLLFLLLYLTSTF